MLQFRSTENNPLSMRSSKNIYNVPFDTVWQLVISTFFFVFFWFLVLFFTIISWLIKVFAFNHRDIAIMYSIVSPCCHKVLDSKFSQVNTTLTGPCNNTTSTGRCNNVSFWNQIQRFIIFFFLIFSLFYTCKNQSKLFSQLNILVVFPPPKRRKMTLIRRLKSIVSTCSEGVWMNSF